MFSPQQKQIIKCGKQMSNYDEANCITNCIIAIISGESVTSWPSYLRKPIKNTAKTSLKWFTFLGGMFLRQSSMVSKIWFLEEWVPVWPDK